MTTTPTTPVKARGPKVSRRARFWTIRIASLAVLFLAWNWYGNQPTQYAVAPPAEVLADLVDNIANGVLLKALAGTLGIMLTGLLIAAVVGIALGLLIGSSEFADNTLTPLVNAGNTAPVTLLIPIIGVYTGIDFWGKVFLVFAFAVFVILINTEAGVRAVSSALIETAESFSLTRLQMVRHVVLPATTPYILTGLRLGVGRAFRGAIVADLLLAVANLGEVLITAGSTLNVSLLLAGILFTTLIGVVLMAVVELAEKRLMPWRPKNNVQDS
jgi:ABC-type nitrate/sulfonate/bicarbonate transport system permease component